MAKSKQVEVVASFQIGDRVKIKHYAGNIGRVVELRGPLGPGGAMIYSVLVRKKPSIVHIEVRGDQLQIAPPSKRAKRPKAAIDPEAT